MKRSKFSKYYKPYWLLAWLRIILVFVPQLGYIHPDEYFQSVEVLASNMFEVEANIPWDFNVTFPIRSIGVSYFTIGTSYKILKTFDYFIQTLDLTVLTPYFLLITPRLFICLLSFLSDYSMYKICINNNEKYKSKLLVLSSSYVMVIYGTRTFSNTLELILFSLLLYYVSDSMIFSNVIVKQHEYLSKRFDATKTLVEKVKFYKLGLYLAPHNLRNSFLISTLTVLGFFNRPTFLFYAVCPVFFWLYRGLGFKSVTGLHFHLRMFIILISAVPTILFLVVIDSFYFGYISWGEIGMLDISIKNFVFPCFNFIKYNLNEKNLEEHGLHPKYLHWFVNVPLLFNVLGLCTLFGFGNMIHKIAKRKYHLLPTVRSIKGLMTTSLLVPMSLLSSFSHQEPRFIIPLIFPMVYLYSSKIYKEPDYDLIESKDLKSKLDVKITTEGNKNFSFWILLNVISGIFYGFLHQGGVYPVVNYLSQDIKSNYNTKYDIVTSHIYNLPQSLLLQHKIDKLYTRSNSKFQLSKRVFVHEEGSKDLEFVFKKIETILKVSERNNSKNKLLFIIPSSLFKEVSGINYCNLNIRNVKTFYPHVSIEALPDVSRFLHLLAFTNVSLLDRDALYESFTQIFKSLGLSIYEISLAKNYSYVSIDGFRTNM